MAKKEKTHGLREEEGLPEEAATLDGEGRRGQEDPQGGHVSPDALTDLVAATIAEAKATTPVHAGTDSRPEKRYYRRLVGNNWTEGYER